MITLRRFFVGLLALTAVVVAAYSVYEMTPERRTERIVSRIKTLYDEILEDPKMEIRVDYYGKRGEDLTNELLEVACHCEPPLTGTGPGVVLWWRNSGSHKEGCLFFELIKEVAYYAMELERKLKKERARRALEESRR